MGYLNILVKEGVVFLKAIWTNENNFRLRFKKSKFSCLLTVRLLKISNKRVGFFLVMKLVHSSSFLLPHRV